MTIIDLAEYKQKKMHDIEVIEVKECQNISIKVLWDAYIGLRSNYNKALEMNKNLICACIVSFITSICLILVVMGIL